MSNHKRQQRIVPTMSVPNGNSPQVPDDIVWDEENPPVLFNCSNMIFHNADCNRQCGEIEVTETRVKLINEGLAWSRAGMNWHGVPRSYAGVIPVVGLSVELTDVLIWLELLRNKMIELTGSSIEEFDEEFANKKLEKLREIRM